MFKNRFYNVFHFALLFFSSANQIQAQESLNSCPSSNAQAVLIHSINNDATLSLDDGRTIKLVGLDDTSPAVLHQNHILLKQLTARAQVRIVSIGTKDRWGQTPVHMFITLNESGTEAWLQGFLLQFGYSRLSLDAHSQACSTSMKALETEAIAARRGLWAEASAIIQSTDTLELMKHRGEMVHVKGEVLGIGETKTVYYLNFGQSWQKDLSVVILKRHLKLFETAGLSPRALDRKHIIMRGIMDGDKGPRMEMQSPAQIQIQD